MSILDAELEFSDNQEETAIGDHDSANILDLGTEDLGKGNPVNVHAKVGTQFATGAGGTLQATLQHGDSNTGPWEDVIKSGVFPAADLVPGKDLFNMSLPGNNLKQFLKMVYSIVTGAMTAGSIDSWLDIAQDS